MAKNGISNLNLLTTNIRSENLKSEPSLMFSDRFCTLIGMDLNPHSLFANIGFNLKDYPSSIRQQISKSKAVLLTPYNAFDAEQNLGDIILHGWLKDLKKIKILTIEGVLIDTNNILPNLPLHLNLAQINFMVKWLLFQTFLILSILVSLYLSPHLKVR